MKKLLRLLLVEDSEDDAFLLLHELKKSDYKIEHERVETEPEMRRALNQKAWDVVIADYNLPRFSAPAALNVLHDVNIDLPFIILSGAIGEETAVEAMRAGAHDYIMKDQLGRLIPAIERELRETDGRKERRAAEQALRDNQELLRMVIDTTPANIIVKDKKGQIILTNQSAADLRETTPSYMIDKRELDFANYSEARIKEAEKCIEEDNEVIETKQALQINDEVFTLKDDSKRYFQTTKIPLTVRGDSNCVLSVSVDITENKIVEQERTRMQDQLLQVQKMDAIGRLTGGVAHDFNNLLTAIHGCTDMAIMRVEKDNPIYHDLREVQVAAGRAADLTHQLLLFSRKHPTQFIPLNLNRIITDVLKMLHRLIGEDVGINTMLANNLWTIRADRGTIEQVIMNLAVNARDAMPSGGDLIIRTENVILDQDSIQHVPEARAGQFVRLTLTDTGVGMNEMTTQHIFEPFFSTKGPGQGTGLGLSVVYGIVSQHEGWIDVTSEMDVGSSFDVYFPSVHEEPVSTEEESYDLEALKGKGERILVVEDEDGLRDFVRSALTKHGYQVLTAGNSAEALNIFLREDGEFDLVFSDVVLPDENGLILLDRLLKEKPDTPVLLTSGYTDHKSQWPIIERKGYPFLPKPYNLGLMLKTIKATIQEKKFK
ncbi:response regulator [candidate division KSB1 bacterium]|nr:response regulator [candidate division KSB1 bacterium]